MASGSEDYWMTKSRFVGTILDNIFTGLGTGSDLLDALDALDGTMDGKLTLSELNTSSVKTNLDTVITKLTTTVSNLVTSVTKLTAINTDTTAMIDFAQDDFSGSYFTGAWYLVSAINLKRNVLSVTVQTTAYYSRDGSTSSGTISGTANFNDTPGVWLKGVSGSGNWDAHEEWAT